jgi:hypothetical protein
MRRTLPVLFFAWLVLCGSAWPCRADEKRSLSSEHVRFFETNIRPLLADHCYKCHGGKKQKADLRLDSRQAILKGSSNGAIVVSGHPEKSLLIRAVRHQDESLKMPPDKKLSERQIADLTRWVKIGLPYPDVGAIAAKATDRALWAFQAPVDPAVPAVTDRAWPRSDLDRFILAKLESKGIRPAPPADRRTLIRRVTFDLIGLPPTPEEVESFVNDRSANAFAVVVDRLLASPHYGERWGRHWLDVARYADSNGLDENVAFGTAWRYRDYVVAAFNQDKPYDTFLREQLAGDLLAAADPATRQNQLIATGFLSLGPKVLAEVDERKMEMDIIDEQIDTVGRTVLGLTLGCARCHDHKFDPLTLRDYYGLAGIFKSTRTMEHFKKVARWHENVVGSDKDRERKVKHERELARCKDAIQQLTRKAEAQVKAAAKSGAVLPKNLEPLFPAEVQQQLKRLRAEVAGLEKTIPEVPTSLGVIDGAIVDVPIHLRGNHLKLGKVVQRHVPQALAGAAPPAFDSGHSGRLELARWLVRPDHPLTARVMVNRIWRWHFGQGIVRTPDNFGRLGEAPDNQPLLDWLAERFIASKWSIKAMHRLIVHSRTYQLSAAENAAASQVDPENHWHWRANVRRLEAEAVRDSLLAVSGLLDRSMGGSLLHVKNREYLFDHTSRDGTKYDSLRRSLYLPVIRNNVYDVFQLFDFPDPAVPNGDRATTTVAPQALFLMNSAWVAKMCDRLSENLLQTDADDHSRLLRLYRKAYGRTPTDDEVAHALELVRGVEAALSTREADGPKRRRQAWACLCQTVVSANEFVYVN